MYLIWLDSNTCLGKNLLIEVEVDWKSAYISETERLSLGCASDYVSEIANVCSKRNAVKIDITTNTGSHLHSNAISGCAFTWCWPLGW